MSNTHERIDDGDEFSGTDDITFTTSITSHIETQSRFRSLLRNKAGTVRTIWRMLLYILIAGILTLSVQGVSRHIFESPGGERIEARAWHLDPPTAVSRAMERSAHLTARRLQGPSAGGRSRPRSLPLDIGGRPPVVDSRA